MIVFTGFAPGSIVSQVSGLAHEGRCPNCLGSARDRNHCFMQKDVPRVWLHAEVRQLGKERDGALV